MLLRILDNVRSEMFRCILGRLVNIYKELQVNIKGMFIIFLHKLYVFELSVFLLVYDIEGNKNPPLFLALTARCLLFYMRDDIVSVVNMSTCIHFFYNPYAIFSTQQYIVNIICL